MRKGQSGPLSGGKHYWAVIRQVAAAHGGRFTVNEVFALTGGVTRPAVTNYVLALQAEGHVALVSTRQWGGRCEKTYRLETDSVKPPRLAMHNDRANRRQQLWRAMRALQSFTIRELACAASTDDVIVTENTTGHYLRWLRRAGYVVLTGREGLLGHYQLVRSRNTGPDSPIPNFQGGDSVLDRNTGEVVNLNGIPFKGWAA